MRVIAGTARGIRLESPLDQRVRPTLERVRESLFSILGDRVLDSRFLDLFAGSGAMGIEALSRGAETAVFVDDDAAHLALIKRNLAKARLESGGRIVRAAIPGGLSGIGGSFDIIYADPPREFADYQTLASEILGQRLLAESGCVIFETSKETEFEGKLRELDPVDSRVYGRTRITILS